MSMASYPFVDTGFYIDGEVAAYIMLASDQAAGCVPEEITKLQEDGSFATVAKTGGLPSDYCDISVVSECIEEISYVTSFDGEISTLNLDRGDSAIELSFGDDGLAYIPAAKSAELFKAAYSSPEELLEEFKSFFAAHGVLLPEDFDWWAHIVSIEGTIFC